MPEPIITEAMMKAAMAEMHKDGVFVTRGEIKTIYRLMRELEPVPELPEVAKPDG